MSSYLKCDHSLFVLAIYELQTPRLGLNEASKYLTRSLDSTHSGQFR
jgi:hypothetical protein